MEMPNKIEEQDRKRIFEVVSNSRKRVKIFSEEPGVMPAYFDALHEEAVMEQGAQAFANLREEIRLEAQDKLRKWSTPEAQEAARKFVLDEDPEGDKCRERDFIMGASWAACMNAGWTQEKHDALEGLVVAAKKVIDMNLQHAEDQYGDRNKVESWACVVVLREALEAYRKGTK
jgi:hypothetical protein